MKLRITPLNIMVAISVIVAIYFFNKPVFATTSAQNFNFDGLTAWFAVGLAVVCSITDLIFRTTLKDLKRIWIVESIFLVLTVILIVIIQKLS